MAAYFANRAIVEIIRGAGDRWRLVDMSSGEVLEGAEFLSRYAHVGYFRFTGHIQPLDGDRNPIGPAWAVRSKKEVERVQSRRRRALGAVA